MTRDFNPEQNKTPARNRGSKTFPSVRGKVYLHKGEYLVKSTQQLSFLPDGPARPVARSKPGKRALAEPGGFPVDPEEKINSIDDALAHLDRELGWLGTLLNRVNDYGLLGSFSQLYGLNMVRYADLLLKKRPANPWPTYRLNSKPGCRPRTTRLKAVIHDPPPLAALLAGVRGPC